MNVFAAPILQSVIMINASADIIDCGFVANLCWGYPAFN